MQFSKISVAVCALALGSTLSIRAADTPAQAAARAAIVSKLFEISAATPATNTASTPAKTEKAVAAAPVTKAAAPVVAKPAPVVAKPMSEPALKPVGALSADAKAKAKAEKAAAKQAAEQKEAELAVAKAKAKADADKAAADLRAKKIADKQAVEQKAAEVEAAKKQAKANMAQPKTPAPAATKPVSAASTDNPAQAAARAAMVHSLFETSDKPKTAPTAEAQKPVVAAPVAQKSAAPAQVTQPVAAQKPAPIAKPKKAAKPAVVEKPAPKPVAPAIVAMPAPPLPINSMQQQRLAELLAKYKADQVTPDEYQKQRAAIIAQP